MIRLPSIASIGHVLDAATAIDDAVGGCVQVVEEENGRRFIRVILERGLKPDYFDSYRIVRSGFRTSCAQAFTERRRVVIRDVRTDPAYEELREAAESAGYRSVQTTPLIDEDSRFHGLFSTYFDRQHHPDPESLQAIDRFAHIAMLVMQSHCLADAVGAADARVRIRNRVLPAAAMRAAETASRLLTNPKMVTFNLEELTASLERVVAELRTLTKQRTGVHNDRRYSGGVTA